jgi:phosphoglycerate dehydrogenase-like enzyme
VKIVLGPWPSEKPLGMLREAFPDVEIVVATNRDEVREAIVDADGFFGTVTPETFRLAKKLRWVQASSAGVEWLPAVPELIESDVIVTNTRGAHAATIGEHVFAMMLTFTRRMRLLDQFKAEKKWGRPEAEAVVEGLVGKTIGIVGLGNIGRAIAQRAHAFDMRVLAVDIQAVQPPPTVDTLYPLDQLHDVLPLLDVLVVAVPLTERTRGLIGAAELALLKPSAYFFVISRGGILDEGALVSALRENRLAGAGLDVTATEPLPQESPLWKLDNLIISPHVSAHSVQTMDLMWQIIKKNIGHFVRGEPLINTVDKRLGY